MKVILKVIQNIVLGPVFSYFLEKGVSLGGGMRMPFNKNWVAYFFFPSKLAKLKKKKCTFELSRYQLIYSLPENPCHFWWQIYPSFRLSVDFQRNMTLTIFSGSYSSIYLESIQYDCWWKCTSLVELTRSKPPLGHMAARLAHSRFFGWHSFYNGMVKNTPPVNHLLYCSLSNVCQFRIS